MCISLSPTSSLFQLGFKSYVSIDIFGTRYPDFCLKQRKYYLLMIIDFFSEAEGYA